MHGHAGEIALPIRRCIHNRVHAHRILAFAPLRKVESTPGNQENCNHGQNAPHINRRTISRYLP